MTRCTRSVAVLGGLLAACAAARLPSGAFAGLWEDALVAVLGAAFAWPIGRCAWVAYGAVLAWTALNAAVATVVGAPLTVTMLRAADPALFDSIGAEWQPRSLLAAALVLAVGVAAPRCAGTRPRGVFVVTLLAAATWCLPHSEHGRLPDNALLALARSAVTPIASAPCEAEWRNPRPVPDDPPLARLRGRANGRNVVLVVLESAAAGHLAAFGGDRDAMPELSRMCAAALVCRYAYAVQPESVKGLVALLHATHPAAATVAEDYVPLPAPSLGEVLRGHGYRTALFHSGRFRYLGMHHLVARGGFEVACDAGTIGGDRESSFGVDETATIAAALAWVDTLAPHEPFCLAWLPVAGHHPYEAPEPGPFTGHSALDASCNALHWVDRCLADLVAGLAARGLLEESLLVVVGDHGQAFGEHPGNFGHTFFLYEENVRVPLAIVAPGLIDEQLVVERPVSHVDLAPTVLDLLGLPLPRTWEGGSLLEPLERDVLMLTDYAATLLALRRGPRKAILDVARGSVEVFDLATDPREQCDLSAAEPAFAEAARQHLLRWAAARRAAISALSTSR